MTVAASRVIDRALSIPVHYPIRTTAIIAVITAAAVISLLRLQPSGKLESMLAGDEPAVVALSRILRDFSADDNLLLVARLPPEAPTDATLLGDFADRLQQHIDGDPELRAMVTEIRYVAGPSTQEREFFTRHVVPASLFYMDDEQFAQILERLTPESMRDQIRRNEELVASPGPAAAAMSRFVLQDPLRLHELIAPALMHAAPATSLWQDELMLSKDRRSILIRVGGRSSASDLDFTKEFLRRIQSASDQANTNGLTVEWSGAYAIAATSERAIRSDMIRSVIGSIVLMQLLFLLMHRGVLTFVLAFVPTGVAIVIAFGAFALIRRELSPITAVVGAIIAGLGVDYSVHLLSHYLHHRRAASPGQAAHASASTLVLPLVGAAGTTLIAMLAIAQSSVQALRDFAMLAAIGLLAALVITLTLLPALLVILDKGNESRGTALLRLDARVDFGALVRGVHRIGRPLALVSVAISVGLAAMLLVRQGELAPIESDLTAFHPQPNRALELQDEIRNDFGIATNSLMIHLNADTTEGLIHAAHRVAAAAQDDELRRAGVAGVYGLSTLFPDPDQIATRRTRVEHIDADRVLRDFRAAVEESMFAQQAFADYEDFLRRLLTADAPPGMQQLRGYGQLAATVLPHSEAHERADAVQAISILMLDEAVTDRAKRDELVTTVRKAINDVGAGAVATLTGMSVIAHDTDHSIRRDLARLLVFAAAPVLALLLLLFRNPLDLMLSLGPTAFALLLLLAGMHVFEIRLNMINLVGIPLLVGLGVDAGIFVVTMTREHRVSGAPIETLQQHLAPTAHAITLTSATTMLAFGSLMLTSTPAIRSLGFLTGIGVAASLAGTLFVLMPAVLVLADRRLRK